MSTERNRPTYAIDFNILAWGVKRQGPKEQISRTEILFDQFREKQANIIVPSVVLSEYLTNIDLKDHDKQIELAKQSFLIFPFDVSCVSLSAKLYQLGASGRAKGKAEERKCLRADCLIVATAKIHGASVIYTSDKKCRNLAHKIGLPAKDVPEFSEHLFDGKK